MWTRPVADSELLKSAQQGDRATLDYLLSAHRSDLFRYLCRFYPSLSPDDIEDAIQITSIQVSTDISRTTIGCSFKAWFYSIAKHRCVDLLRKRRPQDISLDESPLELPDQGNI